MAGVGRISVLVSKDMQALLGALRGLEDEMRSRIRRHTRQAAQPIWQEEVRGRVTTRLQTRVLSDTARVAVSDVNVTLKSATISKLSSGTPAPLLAPLVEFGAYETKLVEQRSRKGTAYKRKLGRVVTAPREKGYVVFPAARVSISRLGSLWAQVAYRTTAEEIEKVMD